MIPKALDEWSLEAVLRLVIHGYEETQTFDFKEELEPKDAATRSRVEASACAFANTEGGFLAFGVVDRKHQPDPTRRIVGIPAKKELPREFGDHIKGVRPTLAFDFKNPPIAIPGTDKVLHVIHVPLSSERPHMTSDSRFYYRDAKGGNEIMPYEMIRESFLRFGERLDKLRMFYSEICLINQQIREIQATADTVHTGMPLYPIDLTVLNLTLVDVFFIVRDHSAVMGALQEMRRHLGMLRVHADVTQHQVILPLTNKAQIVAEYRHLVSQLAPVIAANCTKIEAYLEGHFGFTKTTGPELDLPESV